MPEAALGHALAASGGGRGAPCAAPSMPARPMSTFCNSPCGRSATPGCAHMRGRRRPRCTCGAGRSSAGPRSSQPVRRHCAVCSAPCAPPSGKPAWAAVAAAVSAPTRTRTANMLITETRCCSPTRLLPAAARPTLIHHIVVDTQAASAAAAGGVRCSRRRGAAWGGRPRPLRRGDPRWRARTDPRRTTSARRAARAQRLAGVLAHPAPSARLARLRHRCLEAFTPIALRLCH